MNPFLEIEASGAFSSRVIGRYCHLVMAAQDKKMLLAFVCEAEDKANAIHGRDEVERARRDDWSDFRELAREFLQHAGQ